VILVHLEAFSRCGLALIDAVAERVLACFPDFANIQRKCVQLDATKITR
jgi:hypothetical protein